MERRNQTVIGSYANRDEALDVVRRLRDEGYQREDITLYANRDTASGITDAQGVDVNTETTGATGADEDRSLWDQIKDAFSTDTYDTTAEGDGYNADNDVLYPYRDDINNGNVVVVVNNYRGDDMGTTDTTDTVDTTPGVMGTSAGFPNADPTIDPTVPTDSVTGMTDGDNLPPTTDEVPPSDTVNRDTDLDRPLDRDIDVDDRDEKIRLKEERLNVDKEEVTTGEVNVRKEVVHDTETVEVPVEHEEVVIERKPVSDGETTGETFDTDEENINIPVKEERVNITKRPVVKEEVDIRKETHEDVEHVSEDVRREELDVDAHGDVHVEGTDEDLDPRNRR